jgi:hypothetical protein
MGENFHDIRDGPVELLVTSLWIPVRSKEGHLATPPTFWQRDQRFWQRDQTGSLQFSETSSGAVVRLGAFIVSDEFEICGNSALFARTSVGDHWFTNMSGNATTLVPSTGMASDPVIINTSAVVCTQACFTR